MILDNYHRAARVTYDFHISLFNKLVRPAEAGGSGLIDSLTHRGDRGLVNSVLSLFSFFSNRIRRSSLLGFHILKFSLVLCI